MANKLKAQDRKSCRMCAHVDPMKYKHSNRNLNESDLQVELLEAPWISFKERAHVHVLHGLVVLVQRSPCLFVRYVHVKTESIIVMPTLFTTQRRKWS